MDDRIVKISQLAEIIGKHPKTVWGWIKNKGLPASTATGTYDIRLSDFWIWFESGKGKPVREKIVATGENLPIINPELTRGLIQFK